MNTYQDKFIAKLKPVPTSIFAVMTKMAKEYNAVNLSQGFPDFDISEDLINRVQYYMNNGWNQYSPMPGVPELRQEISKLYRQNHNREYDYENEITITSGGTQALYTAISAVIRNGDEAIVFQPSYDSYAPTIEANGGIVRISTLESPHYSINWKEVAQLINTKTRLIVLNTPHNPTGAIISNEDFLQLQELIKDTNILILSDEVYEYMVFDGLEHHSIARYPELADRSFIVGSFGKSLHATGWKVGYSVAPKYLMNEFRKIHQFIVFAVNTPIQKGIADYLSSGVNLNAASIMYNEKRDFFLNQLTESRFEFIPSKGTYFQLLDYRNISNENDDLFAKKLITDFGIAGIALSPFNLTHTPSTMLRFCFAKTNDTLQKAAEILCKI